MTVGSLLDSLPIPFAVAADWDMTGLQLGDIHQPVSLLAVCHEVTEEVVAAIEAAPVDLLVSYHPLVFAPTRRLVAERSPSGRAYRLVRSGVSLAIVHTAFDIMEGGAADALADELSLSERVGFGPADQESTGFGGRVGRLPSPLSITKLASVVATATGSSEVKTTREDVVVSVVAVVPGSGGSFLAAAATAGADVLITGDVSHHRAVEAMDRGVAVIDAGHAGTERPGLRRLVEILSRSCEVVDLTWLDASPWR